MRALVAACCAIVAGCGSASVPVRHAQPARTARYDVTIASDLNVIRVHACVFGDLPDAFVADRSHVVRASRDGLALPVTGDRIALGRAPDAPRTGTVCIDYDVDLQAHARRSDGVSLADARVVRVPAFLWVPEPRGSTSRATVRLHLPSGMQASVPWPAEGDAYALDLGALRFESYAVFGAVDVDRIDARGVALEIATLDEPHAPPRASRRRWLSEAIRAVKSIDDVFPTTALQAIVIPERSFDNGPVGFGMAGRGVFGSILLFVSRDATEEALVSDWVAVHEMTHLLTPFVRTEEAWLTEGIATYYQEVALARIGAITEEAAMRNFAGGFRYAAAASTGRTLAEETREMQRTHAYARAYWGGAAIVLATDVALRRLGRDGCSFDAALGQVARTIARAPRAYRAEELISALDAAACEPVLGHVADSALVRTDYPTPRDGLAAVNATLRAAILHGR